MAPPVLKGEKWISLGITEPGGGSDVANLATTAVRDGDHFVVSGSKTYITGGMRANWVSTAVRTGGEGAGGVSMLLIPTQAEGFTRTPLDRKMGWWASDTATLYFDEVRVPVDNLIGTENEGFKVIMTNFNSERMGMAAAMEAYARVCLEEAVAWATERKTFGKRLADPWTGEDARQFQHAKTRERRLAHRLACPGLWKTSRICMRRMMRNFA